MPLRTELHYVRMGINYCSTSCNTRPPFEVKRRAYGAFILTPIHVYGMRSPRFCPRALLYLGLCLRHSPRLCRSRRLRSDLNRDLFNSRRLGRVYRFSFFLTLCAL